MAEASVLRRVRAVVAKQVIERGVALHLHEGLTEVIRVRERASTRIGRERLQRLLRREQAIELLIDASTRERADAACAGA